jgi:hypothetical protein
VIAVKPVLHEDEARRAHMALGRGTSPAGAGAVPTGDPNYVPEPQENPDELDALIESLELQRDDITDRLHAARLRRRA